MQIPTDSVRIVLFKPDRSFLVLTESGDPDSWELPGGKLEYQETPYNAAARELLEKLKLTARDVGLRFAGRLLNNDGISWRYIFAGRVNSKSPQPTDHIKKIQWVTISTLPSTKNQNHILSAVGIALA